MIEPIFGEYMEKVYSSSSSDIAVIFGINSGCYILFCPLVGYLIKKLNRKDNINEEDNDDIANENE